ncbi:tetratricopeptide repeat protein [Laceyella putida]|uniref:Tetratricopeptide repeat protein n=1 Tax=Laceyella putida TaxID=110101 RepID=A0ABW2RJE3_9BACL
MKEQFDALMEQAEALPYGEAKIALLEEAVRLADTYHHTERGFFARMELTEATVHVGRVDKAFTTFGWCLAQYDKEPEAYNSHAIMWQYKWIVDKLDKFPTISLAQIEAMLEDLKRRYAELGYTERFYHQTKYVMASRKGDWEEAEREYERWMKVPRDSISDCVACELDLQLEYLLARNHFAEAYERVRPILNGQLSCQSVPHTTYANFLLPLLHEGRLEEAAHFHERGYRLIHDQPGYLSTQAKHLKYLTVVDQARAISCLEKTLPEALATHEPHSQFEYLLAAAVFFAFLDEQEKQVIHIPEHVTEAWLKERLEALAQQFDERNGTSRYRDRIREEMREVTMLTGRVRAWRMEQAAKREESDAEAQAEWAELLREVEAEDPEAMFQLALTLLEGEEEEEREGINWLRRAAAAGQMDALFVLAEQLLERQAVDEGAALLRQAAQAGHPHAMSQLGYRLLFGLGFPRLPEEGRSWLRQSAEAGAVGGMFQYGLCLLDGLGGPPEPEQSESWLRRAAEAGHAVAMQVLGTHLLEGGLFPRRSEEGEHWLRRAAEEGYPPAMHQLGSRLITGDGINAQPQEGQWWLKRATEAEFGPALHELGFRLLEGDGLDKNSLEGEVLLRRAAMVGEESAMLELAGRLLNGDGVALRWGEGFDWLRKAATAELPEAMFLLACYLLDYPDLSAHEGEAVEWLDKAARAGHEKAQELLSEWGEA